MPFRTQAQRREREIGMRVVKFPVLDTGLGVEAGYASDKAMVAAVQAERDQLLTRKAQAETQAAIDRRLLGG